MRVFSTVLASLLAFSLIYAKRNVNERDAFLRRAGAVRVLPPKTPPVPGQKAIDLALVIYNIKIPKTAAHPTWNPELMDRGQTSSGGLGALLGAPYRVTIGTPAFASWGLLGSTLAHELEGHCNQSLIPLNMIGANRAAEAEAYQLELDGARRRFRLAPDEIEEIRFWRDEYAPPKGSLPSPSASIFKLFFSARAAHRFASQ